MNVPKTKEKQTQGLMVAKKWVSRNIVTPSKKFERKFNNKLGWYFSPNKYR